MSFGSFILQSAKDAAAAEQRVQTFLAHTLPTWISQHVPGIQSTVDKIAAPIEFATGLVDPAAEVGEKAMVALFDEFCALVLSGTAKNADGTATLHITAATVASGEKAINDSKAWAAAGGVKF